MRRRQNRRSFFFCFKKVYVVVKNLKDLIYSVYIICQLCFFVSQLSIIKGSVKVTLLILCHASVSLFVNKIR